MNNNNAEFFEELINSSINGFISTENSIQERMEY